MSLKDPIDFETINKLDTACGLLAVTVICKRPLVKQRYLGSSIVSGPIRLNVRRVRVGQDFGSLRIVLVADPPEKLSGRASALGHALEASRSTWNPQWSRVG